MFLLELLSKEEGKTLEFKENVTSLDGIIKTIVAFANTAGGTIVIGVEDKTKKIVGLKDPLADEMSIINKISTSVFPALMPTVDIQTYRKKSVILVHVPYMVGPFAVKKGNTSTVYMRLGSTNRAADAETIASIKLLARNLMFDELPCMYAKVDSLDWEAAEKKFSDVGKELSKRRAKDLGIIDTSTGEDRPSNGGVLLYGTTRSKLFPDAIIRCVHFASTTKERSIDHAEINENLPDAVESVLHFIRKNTKVSSIIGESRRIDIPQYPLAAVREAVINAIIHADYAIKGSSIIVALFEDRIEITNPGSLLYGFKLEDALTGSSRCRNRVIAKTFHALKLIEQWGSGLQKIVDSCIEQGLKKPKFEEFSSQFRVTLYSDTSEEVILGPWQEEFLKHLKTVGSINSQDAAEFWRIDVRQAQRRLKKLLDDKLILRVRTSENDPYGMYIVVK
jgi:ATP-dependent DNA helicase RecG